MEVADDGACDNHVKETEVHQWSWDAAGKAAGMLKIRNGSDTTTVRFTTAAQAS